MHRGTHFFAPFLPFSYIGMLTQRTPLSSVANTSVAVHDAAIVEMNLLSINITLKYINI